MKKLFFGLFLLLFGCQSAGTAEEIPLQTYSNTHYQFSLEFPEDYSYCLNDLCLNTVPDEAVTNFVLLDASGNLIVNVQPYVNLLGMSAVDFGKRSLEMNREYSQSLKDIYSDEEETTFLGQEVFKFLADGGFEERGGKVDMDENRFIALLDNAKSTDPMFSVRLGAQYRVLYFDYGKHIFRVVYLEDAATEKIMESFKLL